MWKVSREMEKNKFVYRIYSSSKKESALTRLNHKIKTKTYDAVVRWNETPPRIYLDSEAKLYHLSPLQHLDEIQIFHLIGLDT
jgi:hypothetical protein